MVDKKELYERIELLQDQIGQFYQELGALKLTLTELMEENQRLQMENANLRERDNLYVEAKVPQGEAQKYLRKLYEDGFHICNVNYGGLRKGDCLFCLEGLQRL